MHIKIGQSESGQEANLFLKRANQHGLIAGATGTGKTVTLQRMAHEFSNAGVPVFVCDIKGDLSGISEKGGDHQRVDQRFERLGVQPKPWNGCPTMFWDVFGEQGHPLRTTISEMGPVLLAKAMDLNDTQTSILQIIFQIADDHSLLILDTKDLLSILTFCQENLRELKPKYGHISPASLGAIQRSLLNLEEAGGEIFFGEPAFQIEDLFQTDSEDKGYVHVLAAKKLHLKPALYSTFLLWLLSELFENLPEVGNPEKPKLALFFDEAHLLFKDTSETLVEKIEMVVRLIRSKGIGVYFVTQSPSDLPETVLGQLGNRVQHALRAYTPKDQKAVRTAAQTFRENPSFSTEEAISNLEVGEALTSFLEESGAPTIVERILILPPVSHLGPVTEETRKQKIRTSPVSNYYDKKIDRESAFETLQKKVEENSDSDAEKIKKVPEKPSVLREILFGSTGPRGGRKQGMVEKVATSAMRSIATNLGRSMVRGILGSLVGSSSIRRRR